MKTGTRQAYLRRLKRRLPLGLGLGMLVGFSVWGVSAAGGLERLESVTFDARARALEDPARADSSIVIVAIDDNSLEAFRRQLGRWPWPREAHAQLVAYLTAAGARLVVYDVMFPELDGLRPLGDTAIAAEIRANGRLVLPMTVQPGDSAEAARWEADLGLEGRRASLERFAIGSAEAAPGALNHAFAEPADPLFLEGAAAAGTILLSADADGVSRRSVPAYVSQGRVYPSLALAAARALDPERFGAPLESLTSREIRLSNGTRLPLADGGLVLGWHGRYLEGGRSTYRILRAADVLLSYNQVALGERTPETADVPFGALEGRVVFVATTAVGTFEPRATPLAPNDPGVMIHAAALDNLLNDGFLRRAAIPLQGTVTVLPALLAGGMLAGVASVTLGALGTLLLLALLVGVTTVAFANGVWLDLAAPLTATSLAFASVMSANYFSEGRERKRVRELFSRYVSPLYVSQLADHYEALRLGGERVPLTLLFSDIRGFTSMSERLPPETVIGLLNEYLARMTEVVFRNGGTLDKFIGDAVMAFWGAPIAVEDHARRALDTALEMMAELDALNRKWAEQGSAVRLDIGIGVNTGEAIVGNIGSLTHKLDYTAIGDTVNLASRLEGLNKELGTHILVSETTRAAAGEGYRYRSLEDVKVKGKEQSVTVFELMGRAPAAPDEAPTRGGSPAARLAARAMVLLALALGGTPMAALAQEGAKERWVDYVYRPGRWTAGRLTELSTTNAATDTLALVARVDAYVRAPRWRAEVRRVAAGDTVGAPLTLVGDGAEVVVLTALGSTPLAEHQAGADSLILAVVGRFPEGRPVRPEGGRFVERGAGNRVLTVVIRSTQARADFPDGLLETGVRRATQGLAILGVQSLGAGRSQEIVASAGPRGVARVRTVDGEIVVNPDAAAVLGMEQRSAGYIELDEFLRELGLGVHAGRAPQGGAR